MSGLSDLSRLLELRALREERARTVVSIAAARLNAAEQAVTDAENAVEIHDGEAGRQEQRFLAAMGIRPVSEQELGRSRDLLGLSDSKRDSLMAIRDEAIKTVTLRMGELVEARAEWRQRLFERDKLAQAESLIRQQEHGRREAANDLEAEEMSADRVRKSC